MAPILWFLEQNIRPKGERMKPSIRFARTLLVASATTILLSGCYTQLATREDDGDQYEKYGAARTVDEQDSTADRTPYYYDDYDQWRGHYRLGFSYYYPSWWYWDAAFADPYYGGWTPFGYPFSYSDYYGYGRGFYGYGAYGYGGYGYYGYDPYGYYQGYPYVVYAGTTKEQTRNSGYRRTGGGRLSGVTGRPATTMGLTPAGRRAGSQGATAAPATRRSVSPAARGTSRSYTPQSSGTSGGSSAPSRTGSPSTRSAPSSGGSRSPEGGTRNSGSTRSRGASDAPMSGYYRSYIGTQSSGSNAVAPASSYYRPSAASQRSGSSYVAPSSGSYRGDGGSQRSSSPSYSSPSTSSAPSSSSAPASSSGGGGGSRSGGASRSGRN